MPPVLLLLGCANFIVKRSPEAHSPGIPLERGILIVDQVRHSKDADGDAEVPFRPRHSVPRSLAALLRRVPYQSQAGHGLHGAPVVAASLQPANRKRIAIYSSAK
jgi:hypothetical protein